MINLKQMQVKEKKIGRNLCLQVGRPKKGGVRKRWGLKMEAQKKV